MWNRRMALAAAALLLAQTTATPVLAQDKLNIVATFSILGLIGDNRLEAASALTTALLAITLLTVALVWRISRTQRSLTVVFDA